MAARFREAFRAFAESAMELTRNIKIDSVSRLNPPEPLRVTPTSSVAEAVAAMREAGVGYVLVCEGERLRGIFTERDLMRRVLAEGKPLTLPVSSCMTPDPVVVSCKDPVSAALRRMEEGGYRHLPVVDEAGHVVGMLSVKRIVRYLVEHYSKTVYNQNPFPDIVQKDRDGA
jgi:CBS domain-containing protein